MLLLFLLLACTDWSFQYGYDSGGEQDACGRPYRSGRVYQPPCDVGKNGYCTSAGSAYPWNAVRRFVRENHGLMRRMYGDQRHDLVLKNEINQPNSENEQLQRGYYRYGKEEKYHFELDQDLDLDLNFDENELFPGEESGGESEGRYLKEDVLNTKFVYSDEPAITIRLKDISKAPHFRPTTHKMTTSKPPAPPISSTSTTSTTSPQTSTSKEPLEETPSTKELPSTNNNSNNSKNTTKNHTVPFFPKSPLSLEEESIINDRTTFEPTIDTTTEQVVTSSTTNLEDSTVVTSTPADGMEKHASVDVTGSGGEDFGNGEKVPPKDTMLFQDMEDPPKNKVQQNYEMRGVNACPVKEEVVAPFWANNTRGEVLALLNMYPFEQYVHWEKCTHEFRQMYCREGCRCEQQYRLHRLLAYDPNNECRGIFSDWFRFPSCCVCKCYGLPQEFRVTSRSPRRDNQQFEDEPP